MSVQNQWKRCTDGGYETVDRVGRAYRIEHIYDDPGLPMNAVRYGLHNGEEFTAWVVKSSVESAKRLHRNITA